MTLHIPVYLASLGFSHEPFPLTPNEDGAFFTRRLASQFSELCHFIELRKGFMLVTGDVGVGKSTLTRVLLAHLETQRVHSALVFNTFLQGLDLLHAITRDFGIEVEGDSFESCLQALNSWLLEQYAQGYNCVLILDDAQGLQVSTLELIRQLCNLESSHAKLLQIVMVAQPEIARTLERHDLRQLTSRIALHLKMGPLDKQEVGHYLHYRLQQAGNANALTISPTGLRLLHQFSGGYIRRLNILADRCLFGFGAGKSRHLGSRLIRRAAGELGYYAPSIFIGIPRHALLKTSLAAMVLVAAVPLGRLLSSDQGLSAESPTVADSVPAVHSPVPEEQIQQSEQWTQFLAQYDGLQLPHSLLSRPARLFATTAPSASGQTWVPVRVPLGATNGCHGQGSFPVADAGLIYFETELPIQTLEFGDKGRQVEALQQTLAQLGMLAADKVDGVMGSMTAAALARFQKQEGIVASGHPDPYSVYLLECSVSRAGEHG